MIKKLFNKTMLLALVTALAMASLPVFGVAAAGAQDPSAPPQGVLTNERLEKIWAKQLKAYEKFGKSEDFVAKVQQLIDRAGANGKDVSAIQTALDAFEAALKDAKPIYASMNGIVNSHQGFDSNGKVTDPEKAKETVKQMGDKLKAIREVMDGTGKALHDAIKAFREANPRPTKSPTP